MSATHLFTFRCRSCKTVMTSPVSGLYRCNACHSGMHLLFSTPILTESDRALAAKGPVFNPGVKKWIPRCAAPDCDKAVSLLYGKSLIEDGALIWFCSQACADLWTWDGKCLCVVGCTVNGECPIHGESVTP